MSTGQKARSKLVRAVIAAGVAYQVVGLREKRGWSQAELAKRARMSAATIHRIEHGGALDCGIQTLVKIAAACDCALLCRYTSWQDFFNDMKIAFSPPGPFDSAQLDKLFLPNAVVSRTTADVDRGEIG